MLQIRRRVLSISLIIIMLLCFLLTGCKEGTVKETNKKVDAQGDIVEKYGSYIPKNGIVNNEGIALRIANIILYSVYGKVIDDEKPLKAEYDKTAEVLVIAGTLPKNHIGGVANLVIKKSDGGVLAIWHTK